MNFGYFYVSVQKNNKGVREIIEHEKAKLSSAKSQEICYDVFDAEHSGQPNLDLLMTKIQAGDVIIVGRLESFARSVTQCINLIDLLSMRSVALKILDPLLYLDNTEQGKTVRRILISLLQQEQQTYINRMEKGKHVKKAYGGRPKKKSG